MAKFVEKKKETREMVVEMVVEMEEIVLKEETM